MWGRGERKGKTDEADHSEMEYRNEVQQGEKREEIRAAATWSHEKTADERNEEKFRENRKGRENIPYLLLSLLLFSVAVCQLRIPTIGRAVLCRCLR